MYMIMTTEKSTLMVTWGVGVKKLGGGMQLFIIPFPVFLI
jgi:hypothetical protein